MPTTTDEIIKTTKQLIALPTTAANPAALQEALDILVRILKKKPGVTVEWFSSNGIHSFLAYHGQVRPEKFDILLNAHVDVVPAGNPDQYVPKVKDGRLYGRGALDMKGTATILTHAFCELVDEVPYVLGLQIVSDEETGGYNGVQHQIKEGVRANFVVMGEYANDRHTIYNAARGICWAEIKFKGKSAHGGHLWHGQNAVLKAGDFAAAVLKHYPTPDKETWTSTASISNISTPNETYNKVPDSAILKIDFRFTQEDPVFRTRESLKAFIADIDPEAVLINLATFEPALHVSELNPYVQGLSVAMEKITGTKPKFMGRPAASDGRHYALAGMDVIEFGLYGKRPHSDNEYVELTSFDEYRTTLREFLRNPVPAARALRPLPKAEPLRVQLLRRLVAIQSVSGNTKANNAALLFAGEFMAERGMFVERYEYNGVSSLLATTRPGNLRPTVLLSAHTDVVPSTPDNFSVTHKDGKLFGRGVMDMKFAIASYLCLVDSLKNQLENHDFGILLTSDEEIGGRNGTHMLVNHEGLRPQVVVVPDAGENWQIETFSKGIQWIKLESAGVTGHASRPWEGRSAITPLLAAIRDIEQLIPKNPGPKDTILTVGTIEGGTVSNQIPAAASAMLDIRYGSMDEFKSVYPRIQAICKQHGITSILEVNDPPCVNDVKNPYIKAFLALITKTTGRQPGQSYSYGVNDGRFFNAAGVPCIGIAPEGGGRHTDAEWISQSSYADFCTIVEQYVREVAGPPSVSDTSKFMAASQSNS
jgi:succinyl-diaminopimelate desuccinylase